MKKVAVVRTPLRHAVTTRRHTGSAVFTTWLLPEVNRLCCARFKELFTLESSAVLN